MSVTWTKSTTTPPTKLMAWQADKMNARGTRSGRWRLRCRHESATRSRRAAETSGLAVRSSAPGAVLLRAATESDAPLAAVCRERSRVAFAAPDVRRYPEIAVPRLQFATVSRAAVQSCALLDRHRWRSQSSHRYERSPRSTPAESARVAAASCVATTFRSERQRIREFC